MKDAVRHLEGVVDRGLLVGDVEQPVVRYHDERVDLVAQLLDAHVRLAYPAPALEGEGQRDDGDDERAGLLRDSRDDGRGPGAGASAHSGGDEDHIRPFDDGAQLLARLHSRFAADLRIGARAEPLRQLLAEDDAARSLGELEVRDVGVRGDEFDACDAAADDVVQRVVARAADAYDLDDLARREIRFI